MAIVGVLTKYEQVFVSQYRFWSERGHVAGHCDHTIRCCVADSSETACRQIRCRVHAKTAAQNTVSDSEFVA